jgi:cytochrome c6
VVELLDTFPVRELESAVREMVYRDRGLRHDRWSAKDGIRYERADPNRLRGVHHAMSSTQLARARAHVNASVGLGSGGGGFPDTEERMSFRSLAIAVAAAIAGASLGYYASGERSRVTATTGGRTVTITKTVTGAVARTIARPDPRAGKRVFVTACSGCHTLKPGDWTGDRVNLADLQPSYRVIVEKVTGGGIVMPSFEGKLSERQIRNVAAFVRAEVAKRGGKTR